MSKIITLTQGQSTIVDDDIYDLLSDRKLWSRYSRSKSGHYAMFKVDGKAINLHRLVMDAPAGIDVDHINGNTLDNRRENLRLATRAQNCWNRKLPRTNTSGYKGVSWRKDKECFTASITTHGKRLFLGFFPKAEEAAEARRLASIEQHGDFARSE